MGKTAMLRFRRSGGWNPSLGCPDPTWRHSWTSVENAELLERYFTSNPSESSYLQRMWDLRVLRNPAASSFKVFLNLSFYLCILCADKFRLLPVVGNERWWILPWCWLKQETNFNISFFIYFHSDIFHFHKDSSVGEGDAVLQVWAWLT